MTVFIFDNNVLSHVFEDLRKAYEDAPEPKREKLRRRLQSRGIGSTILSLCTRDTCLTTSFVEEELGKIRFDVIEKRGGEDRHREYSFRDVLNKLKEEGLINTVVVPEEQVKHVLSLCPWLAKGRTMEEAERVGKTDASVVALAKMLRDRGRDPVIVSGDKGVCDCAGVFGLKSLFTLVDTGLPVSHALIQALLRRLQQQVARLR